MRISTKLQVLSKQNKREEKKRKEKRFTLNNISLNAFFCFQE